MKAMQPSVIKIQDGSDIDYKWVRENVPDAIIVARDWSLGDQQSDMERDPTGTAKHHAAEWLKRKDKLGFDPKRTFVLGINEPKIWSDDGTDAQRVMRVKACTTYTITFLDECKRLGLRAGALQLSVGWPNNTGKDTPPDWSIFPGVEAAIKAGNHCLVTHSYWADLGPDESWGWWGGRILKCPWNVPIIIGECGFEMQVKKNVSSGMRGWMKYITKEQYADQLVDYCNWLSWDSRLLGVCVFLLDYQNVEWGTQDIMPIMKEMVARKGKLLPIGKRPFVPLPANVLRPPKSEAERAAIGAPPVVVPPVVTPPVVVPPVVTPPAGASWQWPLASVEFTQYWAVPEASGSFSRRMNSTGNETYKAHEGVDLRAASGTKVMAAADGVVVYVGFEAKGYGNYIRVRHGAKGAQWDTFYAHLRDVPVLKVGASVRKGDQVGVSGNTGNSTGAHLHFEVRLVKADGTWDTTAPGAIYNGCIDPVTFFNGLSRGVAAGGGSTGYLPIVSQ